VIAPGREQREGCLDDAFLAFQGGDWVRPIDGIPPRALA
jgi:hypothetical protein